MTALLVARPLFASESAAQHGDGIASIMLWIALGMVWLLGAIGRPKVFVRFAWIDAAVAMLLLCYLLATLSAVAHGSARPAVNVLWEWIGFGLSFFLIRQFIATAREARAVVAVMIALAVGVSCYGLYQYGYEMPQTRATYAANPDQALRGAEMWFPPNSPERKAFEDRLQSREVIATFALTNSLAAFLTPWLVMLAGVLGGALRNRKRFWMSGVCLVPILVCLLLTKSRSGYIAAVVGVLAVWWLGRERKIRVGWKISAATVGIVALLISIALAVEGPAVFGRGLKSFGYRVQYWESSLKMIADRPWLGCGPGNFQEVYTQYKLPEASEEVADPHNFLIEIAATAGLPAACVFLAMLAMWMEGLGIRDWGLDSGSLAAASTRRGTEERDQGSGIRGQKSNPQSLIPNPSFFIFLGGVAGFLVSLLLGLLAAAPPGYAPVLIGMPAAAVALVLLRGWVREGEMPGWLPGVGVAAMLIALLTSGGIGIPSVAGSLWLLLALGLEGRRHRVLPGGVAWAALAAMLLLAFACYRTAYWPVLNCQAEMRWAERQPSRMAEHLEAAAAADPLTAEPWRQLAGLAFGRWRQTQSAEDWFQFTRARDKMLSLDPRSSLAWLAAGDWASQSGAAAEHVQYAVRAYRRAAALYPNSALIRAKLAESLWKAGERVDFRTEAEWALRLDGITPHEDKNLPAELRERLQRLLKEEKG
jgi:O-antigen ligase